MHFGSSSGGGSAASIVTSVIQTVPGVKRYMNHLLTCMRRPSGTCTVYCSSSGAFSGSDGARMLVTGAVGAVAAAAAAAASPAGTAAVVTGAASPF